jgi:hypothetical protein
MDKIVNARDKKVSELSSALPDVGAAVQELLMVVVVEKMQKQQIDGYTQEIPVAIHTKVSLQPFTAQQLNIRPEGQRQWRWFTAYTLNNLDLQPDDIIRIKGVRYRIMEKFDWREYGYYRYNVIEDYIDESS